MASHITQKQVQLVRQTWEKVKPISEAAAGLFYSRLFELDPGVRTLFKADMKEQGRKLMDMIGVAVKGLDHPDRLLPALKELGVRHKTYGVKQEHYQTVGQALLETLEKGLGADFTPKARESWTAVYVWIAETMQGKD